MKIGPFRFEFYNPRKHKPVVYGFDRLSFHNDEFRPFAYGDVTAILMMITDRLRNVEFHTSVDYAVTSALFAMLKRDRLAIIQRMFHDGGVRIDISDPFVPCLDGERDREHWRDDDRYIVTIYDDICRMTGKTRAEILAPQIGLLDTVNNADLNLLKNYGAWGLISPENSAHADGYLDDEERKSIENEYFNKYGVTFGRWGLLITRNPVKFQPVTLPVEALQLIEKRKVATGSILQFMNVPKELHVLFESAKYANRNEAELDMYSNCVSSWAEKYTDIARKCYRRIRLNDTRVGYVADNEMWFDFVGVAALQEAQNAEREKAREELAMWRELRADMPERADYINKRINDLIDSM